MATEDQEISVAQQAFPLTFVPLRAVCTDQVAKFIKCLKCLVSLLDILRNMQVLLD